VSDARTDGPLLPGEDLVSDGIADLVAGRETIAAMLVASGARDLRALGRDVPEVAPADHEGRLYALVEAEVGEQRAHARYNALRRRLLSYLRTARAEQHATSPR
jgi:hypothetical protein